MSPDAANNLLPGGFHLTRESCATSGVDQHKSNNTYDFLSDSKMISTSDVMGVGQQPTGPYQPSIRSSLPNTVPANNLNPSYYAAF